MHLAPISDLSIVGILVGALAHFALGAVWYSPALFSKQWEAALKITMDGSGGTIAIPLAVNAAGSIVTTAVVGVLYLWGGGDGPLDGINSGFAVIGFALAGLGYALLA